MKNIVIGPAEPCYICEADTNRFRAEGERIPLHEHCEWRFDNMIVAMVLDALLQPQEGQT